MYTCYSKATSIFQAAWKKGEAFTNNIWHVSCFNGTGPFIMPNGLHLAVFFYGFPAGFAPQIGDLSIRLTVKSAGAPPAGPVPTLCSHPIQAITSPHKYTLRQAINWRATYFRALVIILWPAIHHSTNIACSSSDCANLPWSWERQATNINLYAYKKTAHVFREKTSLDNLVTCTLPCLQSLKSKSIFPFHVQDGMI